jgi:hypothetical protein
MSVNAPHNLMHRPQHLQHTTANRAKHLTLTTMHLLHAQSRSTSCNPPWHAPSLYGQHLQGSITFVALALAKLRGYQSWYRRMQLSLCYAFSSLNMSSSIDNGSAAALASCCPLRFLRARSIADSPLDASITLDLDFGSGAVAKRDGLATPSRLSAAVRATCKCLP